MLGAAAVVAVGVFLLTRGGEEVSQQRPVLPVEVSPPTGGPSPGTTTPPPDPAYTELASHLPPEAADCYPGTPGDTEIYAQPQAVAACTVTVDGSSAYANFSLYRSERQIGAVLNRLEERARDRSAGGCTSGEIGSSTWGNGGSGRLFCDETISEGSYGLWWSERGYPILGIVFSDDQEHTISSLYAIWQNMGSYR